MSKFQVTENGNTLDFEATAPSVLDFNLTTDKLFDGLPPGDPGRDDAVIAAARAKAVAFYKATVGLGADYGVTPSDIHEAYLDLMNLWGETHLRERWAPVPQSVNASSCGLFVRAIWRLLGARAIDNTDPKDPSKKRKSRFLEARPDVAEQPLAAPLKDGVVIALLLDYAICCGAMVDNPAVFKDPARFTPKAGDVFYFFKEGI